MPIPLQQFTGFVTLSLKSVNLNNLDTVKISFWLVIHPTFCELPCMWIEVYFQWYLLSSTWIMYVLVLVQSYVWKKSSLCCSWCKILPVWVTEPKAFLFRYTLLGSALLRPKLFCLCIHLGTLHIEHIWCSCKIMDFTYSNKASFTIKCLEMHFFRFCRWFMKCSLEHQNLLIQTFWMKWKGKETCSLASEKNPDPRCRWEQS